MHVCMQHNAEGGPALLIGGCSTAARRPVARRCAVRRYCAGAYLPELPPPRLQAQRRAAALRAWRSQQMSPRRC